MGKKLANSELGRISVNEFKDSEKTKIVLVLDNIRSLNNVGSAFRTADAFLLEAIYLCGVTGTPPHPEIHKTALGATDSVKWEKYTSTQSCIDQLKQEGYIICCIEQTQNSVFLDDLKADSTKKYALVFGNEVYGVEQNIIDNADIVIEIPQFGSKHSLNVSVSIGIICWEFIKQLK